ncbi:endo-1,4-beta-xylanase [Pontiellaceae bacterium B12227]|nr:endo-1,4-beta-xylanase [Pontiellaceae bacterium B12227]
MKTFAILLILPLFPSFSQAGFQSLEKLESELKPRIAFQHAEELLQHADHDWPEGMAVLKSDDKAPNGAQAVTIQLSAPSTSPYSMNLQFFQANSWEVGDSGLIAFHARSISTENRFGASSLMLQYKPDYSDWRGHKETDLFLSNDWTLILLPFEVTINAPDTERTVLSLFLGGVDPHTFQLADLRIYNFKKTIPFSDLPQSKAYYPGIEPDAPWRAAAAKRIEETRKATLNLRVLNSDGTPAQRAKVHLKLKRHKFGFGAAVHTPQLVSDKTPATNRKAYSDILTRTCSKITPTNAMKWRLYDHFKEYVPDLIAWCGEHDMTLRGHLFIWPGFERLPEGYDLYQTDPEAFRKDLTDHILEFATLYPDAFSEWDVMNEPYTETDYMDLLGKEVVLDWFNAAREANTNYLTYINDFGILSDNNQEHQDNYYGWISWLIENDAPLNGIGFQGHYRTAIPPELIYERIERFAAFGKKMQITEFDFKHTDSELQARFFEDFVTLIYSHPQMEALINWIFIEDNFRPEAALYRKDFSLTAMGKVWEHLLTEQWHTEKELRTDDTGCVNLRGFKGIYNASIQHEDRTEEFTISLKTNGTYQLTFPPLKRTHCN